MICASAIKDLGLRRPHIVFLQHGLMGQEPVIVEEFRVCMAGRYANWLLDLFQGDMGVSVRAKMPVMQMIGNRIGPSLFLMVTGLVLSVLIAIPLGVAAA